MFRTVRSATDDVRAELRRLSVDFTTFQLEGAWLVVGPTGIFVVCATDDDVGAAGLLAVRRAEEIRDRLARQLAWVPFVDAIVATSHPDGPGTFPCIALDVSLLRAAIADGPRTVGDEALATLARLQFPQPA